MGLFDLFKKKEEITDVNPIQGTAKAAKAPSSGVTYKVVHEVQTLIAAKVQISKVRS